MNGAPAHIVPLRIEDRVDTAGIEQDMAPVVRVRKGVVGCKGCAHGDQFPIRNQRGARVEFHHRLGLNRQRHPAYYLNVAADDVIAPSWGPVGIAADGTTHRCVSTGDAHWAAQQGNQENRENP